MYTPTVTGTLPELCDKLLSLIASYPEACARGVRRMTADTESLKRLGVAFSAIGYEYSRQLFPWITDLQWFMMESHAAQTAIAEGPAGVGRTVLSVFTELLAESMDTDAGVARDPFAFLQDLDNGQLSIVMQSEAPAALALIATHWGPSDMGRILRVVPENTRIQTILHIARLSRIPETEARKSAARFADHLRAKAQGKATKPQVRPSTRSASTVSVGATSASAPTGATVGAIAKVSPPPPPVPRLQPSGLIDGSVAAAAMEEELLASLRTEAPEIYRELAQGNYFQATRRSN